MPGTAGRWVARAVRGRTKSSAAERLERRVGLGIAILVPMFAVIGTVAMLSEEGPSSTPRRVFCVLVLLSTLPVGAWWWIHGREVVRMPGWFVAYADLGVAGVLFTLSDRGLALHASVLFAVIGIYIAYFSTRSVLRLHYAFVSTVIVVIAVGAAFEETHDVASIVAQTLITLVVVNSVIVFRTVIKAQLDLANTDSLTGLLNRRGFEIQIDRLLVGTEEDGIVAVFVVDLDRFKYVNDTHGHAAGDAVLRTTARRLAAAVPEGSCVARTGGEEFTVAASFEPADASAISAMGDRLASALQEETDDIPVTGSVGGATLSVRRWKELPVPEAGEMVHAALLRADAAMYEAKRSGGNRAMTTEY
ncbi:MAG: GGDEF domain-containing protein [Rhodococcus sp. (in: high G+C Gram-positive bacteria)]